jgi:hypothetical protein
MNMGGLYADVGDHEEMHHQRLVSADHSGRGKGKRDDLAGLSCSLLLREATVGADVGGMRRYHSLA